MVHTSVCKTEDEDSISSRASIMKRYISLFLLMFLLAGCEKESVTQSDQKWLESCKAMLVVGDPLISTTNANRVKLFIEWAVPNGYSVKVSNSDPVANKRSGMYFMVVKTNL